MLTSPISLLLLWLIPFVGCATIYPQKTAVAHFLVDIPLKHLESGLEKVDCIYVINLRKRPEKWQRMRTLLKELGLKPNRVEAIDGWKLSPKEMQTLAGPYPVRLRGGQAGCILSHLSTLRDAAKRNFNIIWVMEDDLEILENIKQVPSLLSSLEQLDPDWDILYTDTDTKDPQGNPVRSLCADFRPDQQHLPLEYYLHEEELNADLKKIGQRFGAYSLLISQKGIKKILHYFTHVHLWTSYDIDIHYVPGLREYSTRRDIVSIWWGSQISDTNFK